MIFLDVEFSVEDTDSPEILELLIEANKKVDNAWLPYASIEEKRHTIELPESNCLKDFKLLWLSERILSVNQLAPLELTLNVVNGDWNYCLALIKSKPQQTRYNQLRKANPKLETALRLSIEVSAAMFLLFIFAIKVLKSTL